MGDAGSTARAAAWVPLRSMTAEFAPGEPRARLPTQPRTAMASASAPGCPAQLRARRPVFPRCLRVSLQWHAHAPSAPQRPSASALSRPRAQALQPKCLVAQPPGPAALTSSFARPAPLALPHPFEAPCLCPHRLPSCSVLPCSRAALSERRRVRNGRCGGQNHALPQAAALGIHGPACCFISGQHWCVRPTVPPSPNPSPPPPARSLS